MSENDFPMLGYEYDALGYYVEPVVIENRWQLHEFMTRLVAVALVESREVRITDRTADDLLFHIRDGKVVWYGGSDNETFEQMLRAFAAGRRTVNGIRPSCGCLFARAECWRHLDTPS